jgi:adenine-specific DNA-methyltransferase
VATATVQKTFGAFYTAEPIARTLVKWAIRSAEDSVLDPSCGDGVFLSSAASYLESLGATDPNVWGIDVDKRALQTAGARHSPRRLIAADFFSLSRADVNQFSAIIGNPPFIRYQTFNGANGSSGLARAKQAGVHLPKLSSSWAPFLVHATTFLNHGGRLAMVVPAELGHAQYAREVLRFLVRSFGRIRLCLFRKKLFPDLSEDTNLLFCDEFQNPCRWFSVAVLEDIKEAEQDGFVEYPVDITAVQNGQLKFAHYLLSSRARQLYEDLSAHPMVARLGSGADVGIGYVTGCNDYFHLSASDRQIWRIPDSHLSHALPSLREPGGAIIRGSDWRTLRNAGLKVFLLNIPVSGNRGLPKSVLKYLEHGRRLGVPQRFKCRVRDPWYAVPHVRAADAFLSYMSGKSPRLVLNSAHLVAPNTLHVLRFHKAERPAEFVTGWYSSLTKLSCELEGHPLGGGMLKLEPSEAERVLIALPRRREVGSLLDRVDELLRGTNETAANELIDTRVLRFGVGLSGTECALLQDSAREMYAWRMHK